MMAPDLGRIEKAKEERRIQLLNWGEYDRNYVPERSKKARKIESKNVAFGPELVFLDAAARGDLFEVKRLIGSGINPDVTNEDGLTALHQCCIDNNLEMCTLLLENNANVNAQDNELWTPLHAATTCGHKQLCGLLINWGADLLAINVDGNMPYDLCEDETTLILVETEMANRNVTQKQIDDIRLRPEKEIIIDLNRRLAEGDDLQALDSQGAAPIHVACACGFVEMARFLLQHKIDPHLSDQDGWLPIHIAVCWGQMEVVELLVSYGADMEAHTRSGQTVFTICDSKELRFKLKEIWDRRQELRNAIKQNYSIQEFNRGRGSSKHKKNSSILRSSMRDKHRLSRTEAAREKQLGEQMEAQIVNEEDRNGVETITLPPSDLRAGFFPAKENNPISPPARQTSTFAPVATVTSRLMEGDSSSNNNNNNNNNNQSTPKRVTNGTAAPPFIPPRAQRPSVTSLPNHPPEKTALPNIRPTNANTSDQTVLPVEHANIPPGLRPTPPLRDCRNRTPKPSQDVRNNAVRGALFQPSTAARSSIQEDPMCIDYSLADDDSVKASSRSHRGPFNCCHTM